MGIKLRETHKKWLRNGLMVLMDIGLTNAAMILALQLVFDMSAPENHIVHYWHIAPIMTVVTIGSFMAVGLYKNMWQYASVDALVQIGLGTLIGSGLTYLISLGAYMISQSPNLFLMPRPVYLVDWLILLIFIGASRMGIRMILQWRKTGVPFLSNKQRGNKIMVIGAGWAGAAVIREIQAGRYGDSQAVLALDDDPSRKGTRINRVPVVMGTDRVEEYAKEYEIDEIIIAIATPKGQLQPLIEKCVATKCRIRMVTGGSQDINDMTDPIRAVRDINIDDLLGRTEQHLDMTETQAFFENKRVLITGGGGSIGSELCRQIMNFSPKSLVIYDISENYMHDLFYELEEKYGVIVRNTVSLCVGSVTDIQRLNQIFDIYSPDIVIHAAAHKHVPLMEDCPEQAVKNNVFGTYNVAQCAMAHSVKRFVMISTDKAVNPTNVMGATKRMGEMIIEAFQGQSQTDFMAVRFGNVLGSHGSVIPIFERQIKSGGPITLMHPDIIRYFMTIPEAASLVLQAAAMARGGEIFVLDMGEPVKIKELAERMILLYARPDGPPIEIKCVGLRPGEKLYEELLRDDENVMKTAHEKIFVAKPEQFDLSEINRMLAALTECLESGRDMRRCMHELLPSFLEPDIVNNAKQSATQ